MPALLADENFNGNIVCGLLRRSAEIDIIRVQDIGLAGQDDPAVLERAAQLGRVLLTHDAATLPDFAFARIAALQRMPGVLVIRRSMAVGQTIDGVLWWKS